MNTKTILASVAILIAAGSAQAAVVQSSTLGQFNLDSAGMAFSSIDFADGIDNDSQSGASYSSEVTFSTLATGNGGITGGLVNDSALEIGPYNRYDGGLVMDFASAIQAFSMRTYQFNAGETISLYDNGSLIYSASSSAGSFDGIVGTGGMFFNRVVLNGSFYSLASLNFSFAEDNGGEVSEVPLPASSLLLLAGLGGLAALRRRKKS